MDKAFIKAFTKECYAYVVTYETEAERVRKRTLAKATWDNAKATWDNALSAIIMMIAYVLQLAFLLHCIVLCIGILFMCAVLMYDLYVYSCRFQYAYTSGVFDDAGRITSAIVSVSGPLSDGVIGNGICTVISGE